MGEDMKVGLDPNSIGESLGEFQLCCPCMGIAVIGIVLLLLIVLGIGGGPS